VRRLAVPDEPPTNGLPEGETGEPTEGQPPGAGDEPELTPPVAVAQAQVTIQPFAVSDQAAPGFNPDVMATLETSLNAGPPCGANGPAGFPAPVGRTDFFLNAHPFTVADDGAQHLGLPTVEERPVVGQDSFFPIDRPPVNDLTGILRVPSGPQTWSSLRVWHPRTLTKPINIGGNLTTNSEALLAQLGLELPAAPSRSPPTVLSNRRLHSLAVKTFPHRSRPRHPADCPVAKNGLV
jgi:hypothetical protein